jgi:Right handed beta helix region
LKEPSQRSWVEISEWPKIMVLVVCAWVVASVLFIAPIKSMSSTANVVVHPGDNIQALVKGHPPNTSFTISPGVYRLESISPKDSDSFIGEPGAVLSGAQVLTSFVQQGQYWVAKVNVQSRGSYRGECDPNHPACVFPEDLFMDDAPLQRVADLSDVGPGKWYLDYGTGRVYLGDNPDNHTVEISLIDHAFYGSATNVTICGLMIEKYADLAGDGAIEGKANNGQSSQGWVIQDNVIRFNHGMGIRLGNRMQVLSNKVMNNGQMGLGGSGDNILVAGNEIAFNNYAGYKYGWEAGGTKFTFTKDLVVRDNSVHNNNGPGLWTDIENRDTLYEHNQTTANKEAGILHEISYHAVIRDNTIENDGFDGPGKQSPWYGAGIIITGSENVEVYGNTVTDCMNGIVGLQPNRTSVNGNPYSLRNLSVHDNVITQKAGVAAGILASKAFGNSVYTSCGNRFANNTFHLANASGRYFRWMDAPETLAAWRSQVERQ